MRIVFAAVGFIGGDADMVQGVLLFFQPVGLLGNQMGFKLAGTPANFDPRPAVAIGRYAQPGAAFQTARLLLRFLEHHPLKAVRVAQSGDVDAALLKKKIIQLGDMGLHLRELHASVRIEYAVDGQALFDHQNQKTRAVFST